MPVLRLTFSVFLIIALQAGIPAAQGLHAERHTYVKVYNPDTPAGFEDFHDGFPLGNGDMGATLGGGPEMHVFSLAKSDLWDSRIDVGYRYAGEYKKVRELVDRGDWDGLHSLWQKEKTHHLGSFLTAGRLTVQLPETIPEYYEEKLVIEEARVEIIKRSAVMNLKAEAFICAEKNLLVIQYTADRKFDITVTLDRDSIIPPPLYSAIDNQGLLDVHMPGGPWYAAGVYSPDCRNSYAGAEGVTLKLESDGENRITIYCAASSENDSPDPVSDVRIALEKTTASGIAALRESHKAWWREYFNRSSLSLPRKDFERGWYFEIYKMGACSRPGKQAPGLFGLWVGDDRPGWSGDYHLDLNVQMQMWPLYTANHLEQTESFLEMYRDILPEAKRYAQVYYGYPTGAKYPLCTFPKGGELHVSEGWLAYQFWTGVNAWAAEAFIWYYRCKPDPEFAGRWLPLLEEMLLFYEHNLEVKNGQLIVPLTASPEAGETTPRMWGKNATIDLCLIRQMANGMIEIYEHLKIYNEHYAFCKRILRELIPYPVQNGVWCELEGWNFEESHRHCSVLMPIYPTAEVNLFDTNSPGYGTALATYRAFVARGEDIWCSYTYPWLAAIAARLGLKEETVPWLEIFENAFRNVNGLTINFDWKKLGHGIQGRKFHILEGGNGFAAALNEMVLQSHNGVIQVFPGCPDDWEVSFTGFLAFGGFSVSASKIKEKAADRIVIKNEYGKTCRVKNPWKKARVITEGRQKKIFYSDENIIEVPVRKEQTAVLTEYRDLEN